MYICIVQTFTYLYAFVYKQTCVCIYVICRDGLVKRIRKSFFCLTGLPWAQPLRSALRIRTPNRPPPAHRHLRTCPPSTQPTMALTGVNFRVGRGRGNRGWVAHSEQNPRRDVRSSRVLLQIDLWIVLWHVAGSGTGNRHQEGQEFLFGVCGCRGKWMHAWMKHKVHAHVCILTLGFSNWVTIPSADSNCFSFMLQSDCQALSTSWLDSLERWGPNMFLATPWTNGEENALRLSSCIDSFLPRALRRILRLMSDFIWVGGPVVMWRK